MGVAADVPAERLFGAALIVFEARKTWDEGISARLATL
jgi:hypothetical protein